ncbi:hypothetical protein CN946_20915, partial [Bacillus sp. AFS053548]
HDLTKFNRELIGFKEIQMPGKDGVHDSAAQLWYPHGESPTSLFPFRAAHDLTPSLLTIITPAPSSVFGP